MATQTAQAPSPGTVSISTPVLCGISRAVLIEAALAALREASVADVDKVERGRIVVRWVPEP